MADIDEMQQRITVALGRIGTAADRLARDEVTPALRGEIDTLTQALNEEKTVSAQLEERVRGLNARHEEELNALRATIEKHSASMTQFDDELQRLRAMITQLRENNAALREANASGLSDPNLINLAMLSEIEALRAERDADVAEASAILSALQPMVASAQTTEVSDAQIDMTQEEGA